MQVLLLLSAMLTFIGGHFCFESFEMAFSVLLSITILCSYLLILKQMLTNALMELKDTFVVHVEIFCLTCCNQHCPSFSCCPRLMIFQVGKVLTRHDTYTINLCPREECQHYKVTHNRMSNPFLSMIVVL